MPDLRNRAIAIVGHRFNQQGDTAWSITLVGDFFVMDAFFFARAAPNRSVDRIVWHVAGLRVANRFSQTRVCIGIPSTRTGGNCYFFNELGEKFAALGIERAFLVFNGMPLRMSRHFEIVILISAFSLFEIPCFMAFSIKG